VDPPFILAKVTAMVVSKANPIASTWIRHFFWITGIVVINVDSVIPRTLSTTIYSLSVPLLVLYGIHFTGYPRGLEGYSDSNWISDAKINATSGYVFTLGGDAVS
jgi:hypothetical protein